MNHFKLVIAFMFLFTMIGFEVLNNITVYHTVENAEISDIEDVIEKYKSEREGESSEESRHAPELTLHDLCRFASMREFVKVTTIVACDLNYQLLEQKVVSPPPEFSFS